MSKVGMIDKAWIHASWLICPTYLGTVASRDDMYLREYGEVGGFVTWSGLWMGGRDGVWIWGWRVDGKGGKEWCWCK